MKDTSSIPQVSETPDPGNAVSIEQSRNIILARVCDTQCPWADLRARQLSQQINGKVINLHSNAKLTQREGRPDGPFYEDIRDIDIFLGSRPVVDVAIALVEKDSDLIVVDWRAPSIGERLFGRRLKRLLMRSRVPVLVVKTPSERPYDKVLIATKLDAGSGRTVQVVAELFDRITLTLINSFLPAFQGFLSAASTREYIRDERNRSLSSLLSELPKDLDHRIDGKVVEGEFATAIFSEIRLAAGNIVVIGNRRKNIITRALLGSKAVDVVDTAPADVLVVPVR